MTQHRLQLGLEICREIHRFDSRHLDPHVHLVIRDQLRRINGLGLGRRFGCHAAGGFVYPRRHFGGVRHGVGHGFSVFLCEHLGSLPLRRARPRVHVVVHLGLLIVVLLVLLVHFRLRHKPRRLTPPCTLDRQGRVNWTKIVLGAKGFIVLLLLRFRVVLGAHGPRPIPTARLVPYVKVEEFAHCIIPHFMVDLVSDTRDAEPSFVHPLHALDLSSAVVIPVLLFGPEDHVRLPRAKPALYNRGHAVAYAVVHVQNRLLVILKRRVYIVPSLHRDNLGLV